MKTTIIILLLAVAASYFLKPRRRAGSTLTRQIIFWLIFLSVSTVMVAQQGWPRALDILLCICFGIAICALGISAYARRSISRIGAMPPEQREQVLAKMPPVVRDRIVQGLSKDAA